MEALAAVSLSGNIIQFTQFALKLLSNTRKIHQSASGGSAEQQHISDICEKLRSFNAQFEPSLPLVGHSSRSTTVNQDLLECAASCRKDCTELLELLDKLPTRDGSSFRTWRSFRAALAEQWKAQEIEDLRTRLADRERAMILQLCKDSHNGINRLHSRIEDLCRWRESAFSVRTLPIEIELSQSRMNDLSRDLKKLELSKNFEQMVEMVEGFCRSINLFSQQVADYDVETTILMSLDYEERPLRHENIAEAHAQTFAWGVMGTENEHPALDEGGASSSATFRRWLSSGHGYFWVSGRPGSGKSTFMKHVSDHRDTCRRLEHWAGATPLVFAAHYFTIYGTEVQKSLKGLLRSLLLAVFKDHPKLMAVAFPGTFEGYRQPRTAMFGEQRKTVAWTLSELESALKRIVAAENLPIKMCFFIDGLDEYSGDHNEISETLQEISKSPSVKLCISSRPWNVFEDAFGGAPYCKLYMHELTMRDIRNYTTARLQGHRRWAVLVEDSGPEACELIDEVVRKANGVFLWVVLVTRFLRENLNNDDTLLELKRSVDSYSTELHSFFEQILSSVAPMYHAETAATLRVALEARSNLTVEMYHFLVKILADAEFAFRVPTEQEVDLAAKPTWKAEKWLSRRLNGRCRGLLEQNRDKIVFLHRTVYDYLRSSALQDRLKSISPRDFSPKAALLQVLVARMMRSNFRSDGAFTKTPHDPPKAALDGRNFAAALEEVWLLVHKHIRPAQQKAHAEVGDKLLASQLPTLLDLVDSHLSTMVQKGQFAHCDTSKAQGIYRLFLLERNLTPDLPGKLLSSDYFQGSFFIGEHQLLPAILRQSIRGGSLGEHTAIATKRLLQQGHRSSRPYAALLVNLILRPGAFVRVLELGILEVLLNHGASRHVTACLSEKVRGEPSSSYLPASALVLLLAPIVPRSKWDLYERMARKAVGSAFEASDLDIPYLRWAASIGDQERFGISASQTYNTMAKHDAQDVRGSRAPEGGCTWTIFKRGILTKREENQQPGNCYEKQFVLHLYASVLSRLEDGRAEFPEARKLATQAIGRDRGLELGQLSQHYRHIIGDSGEELLE